MSIIQGLLYCWNKNMQYGPKLVEDLTEDQMLAQPAPEGKSPANHPAWIFSHLNAYHPVIESLINGVEFEDPKQHPFGMLSKPEADPAIYETKQELVDRFVAGHQAVERLLSRQSDSLFAMPVKLSRWAEVMPTVGNALPYLMLNHENLHLGQLSAWRRIQGLPSV